MRRATALRAAEERSRGAARRGGGGPLPPCAAPPANTRPSARCPTSPLLQAMPGPVLPALQPKRHLQERVPFQRPHPL